MSILNSFEDKTVIVKFRTNILGGIKKKKKKKKKKQGVVFFVT